ncbi:MAG: hypothetical protein RI975_917 [Pseudomonadota bacterium]
MKKFLATFAGIAASFASHASTQPLASQNAPTLDSHNIASPQTTVLGENIATIDSKGDQFNFILKKSADTGLMMAYHSSHSSHASHASHSSHYSSRR